MESSKRLMEVRKAKAWNVEALKGSMRREYQEPVENSIREIESTNTVEERWDNIKTGIVIAAEKSIGYQH